jgi:hypothetical protein
LKHLGLKMEYHGLKQVCVRCMDSWDWWWWILGLQCKVWWLLTRSEIKKGVILGLYNKFRVTMNMCEIGDEIYMEYTKILWPLATCETKEGNMHIHWNPYSDFQWHMEIYRGNTWKLVYMGEASCDFKKLSSWDFVASSKHMI